MLIDTHTHVNLDAFDEDRDEVLERARSAGVLGLVVIGFDLPTLSSALEMARERDGIWVTAGLHPHDADRAGEAERGEIERLAECPEVVAVGECGLDYYRNYSSPDAQRSAFRWQIGLARELGKPLVIHNREAFEEVVQILREEGGTEAGGVFHAFSGDADAAREALDLGFYLGIGGPLTFKNSKLGERIADVALDRILMETDCPWLTPHPHRGKRNEPAYVALVADRLAELREIAREELERVTTENARRLFGLEGMTAGG
jgi:TatD DNase family protein